MAILLPLSDVIWQAARMEAPEMSKAVVTGTGSLGIFGAWLGAGTGIAYGGDAFNGLWLGAVLFGLIGGLAGALWSRHKS